MDDDALLDAIFETLEDAEDGTHHQMREAIEQTLTLLRAREEEFEAEEEEPEDETEDESDDVDEVVEPVEDKQAWG